ncbi:MAG: hypothetical protein QMB51_03780 [Patescibacteria group bacterium]
MQITWEGKDIIKIVSEKNTILINADKKSDATVVLCPEKEEYVGSAFSIHNPGEYEVNDDFFYVDLFTKKDNSKSRIFRLNIEDINIVDLNRIDSKLDLTANDGDSSYDNIIDNKLDVLILPIGEGFLDIKDAIAMKNEFSPKLVLAINYDLDSEKDQKRFNDFKSSFNAVSEAQDKFKLTKKNLPGQDDEIILVVLNKTK